MNVTLKRSYQLIVFLIVFLLHLMLGIYIFTMLDLYKATSLAMLVPFDDETSVVQFMPGAAQPQPSLQQPLPQLQQQQPPTPTPLSKEEELELERMHFAPAKKSMTQSPEHEQELNSGKKEVKKEMPVQPALQEEPELEETLDTIKNEQSNESQEEQELVETRVQDAVVIVEDSYEQPAPKPAKPAREKKVAAPAAPKKPQLTVQDLARQFMNQSHASNNSPHVMDVTGDSSDTPSPHQITQERYVQKIIGCLVNSYSINRRKAPQTELPKTAAVYLALNPNGSIYRLEMVQSSGAPLLDQFIMHMFTDASSSFPPMPQVFNNKRLELPVFTFDTLRAFESVGYWRISVNSKFLP